METSIYWDLRRTLTYNALFYVILGNRGGGKSFGAKWYAIDRFIKYGEQFGYIRRYKEDLKEPMKQYFKDIEFKYPDYEFKSDDKYFYIRKKTNREGGWKEKDIAGYGFSLSTANNKKSISYPNVTTLIYDEFLIDKGFQKYIPNEPMALLNLYETVARPGTDHPKVILLMLANAISITNPYFLYFDLKMPTKKDKNDKWIWKHPTKPIIVEEVKNEAFIDKKKNTEFGQIIKDTAYADYSIEDKFLLDDNTFVEKKNPKARYYFTFIYMDHTLSVWADFIEGLMYVSDAIDPTYPIVYTITMKDHKPNTMFLKNKNKATHFKLFIESYQMGNVRFESINIKNICYEVIKLSLN